MGLGPVVAYMALEMVRTTEVSGSCCFSTASTIRIILTPPSNGTNRYRIELK